MKTIYEYRNYKSYLIEMVGNKSRRSGFKSKLAKAAQCSSTLISQVLYGNRHFTLEQAESLAQDFMSNEEERRFFILLVQMERAGTLSLKKFFNQQIDEVLFQRDRLQKRLKMESELPQDQQNIYYSSWEYAAVHMATTLVGQKQVADYLANELGVSPKRTAAILNFLLTNKIISLVDQQYRTGKAQLHLSPASSNIIKHHTNWRLQAIHSLERNHISDFHYSAVMSVGEVDRSVLREILSEAIEKMAKVIKTTTATSLQGVCLDLFDLKR